MRLDDYFDFLAPDDIRLRGTRVGIETILYDTIHRDRTPAQIVASYPSLTLEQVHATLAYYFRTKEQIDRYLSEWLEWGERSRAAQAADPAAQDWLARMRRLREERHRAEIPIDSHSAAGVGSCAADGGLARSRA